MASMRAIKRRIRSISSTQQITRAMNLVAASKLTRAKAQLESIRPFYNETRRVVGDVVRNLTSRDNQYLVQRQVNHTGVIVITGDRGLCGGYNVNVSKRAMELIEEKGNEQLIPVGSNARDYFRRRKKNIIRTYQGISEAPYYEDASEIGGMASELFNSGEVDEVYLVYTEFVTTLTHTPKAIKLLPIEPEAEPESEDRGAAGMSFEPNEAAFLDYVIPKYLSTLIYGAMVESAACEQGARMASMDNATKNSTELINRLSLQYNRARQDAITQELTEIVSGANALE
jgi:F-type H+-transporting ATPase subunit gamma